MKRNEMKLAMNSVLGLTVYSVDRQSDSWSYATVRRVNGCIQVTAQGANTWQSLGAVEGSEFLRRHGRAVVKLARHLVAVVNGDVKLGASLGVVAPCYCESGCGYLLTHPRSALAKRGPGCRGETARRDANRAARSETVAGFMARAARLHAERRGH